MVETVLGSLLSSGEEDMFGNSVGQDIPTSFSRKKMKKVFGWDGVWVEEVCCLFSPKGSKSFAATTKAVTSWSLESPDPRGGVIP